MKKLLLRTLGITFEFLRRIWKPMAWIFYGLLILIFVTVSAGLGYRALKQSEIRSKTQIKTANGIESLELISVNGSKQWIYLRGHDQDNPVLLFLHGGPGSSEMALARTFGLELEKHMTVVHWDQRASGKSRRQSYDEDDLTIQTYLDDTLSVVNQLRKRFDQDKLYLVGHSWGSTLGVYIVRDHPELFHAYVGMGQSVRPAEGERISFEYVKQRARAEGNLDALAELASIQVPYIQDPSEIGVQRKWLAHYDGLIGRADARKIVSQVLTSPEYSILDLVALYDSINLSLRMWPEKSQVDFFVEAPKLDVPVYFFLGRHDHQVPFELAERYFALLEAPSKQLIWFENGGHAMNFSQPDFYQDMLINQVLAETSNQN